jgi:hypothetical protein
MADKKNIGKGHFDVTEGSVKHVYVTKNNPLSSISDNEDYLKRKKAFETREFVERRMKMAGPETLKKLPGTVGKAVAAGALAGVALEKGINKIKSMEGKEAEPEIPSDVEGKAKGGQAKVGRVMREFKKGKLHSGKKGPVVKNPKQAIAIALSEAGMSKPQKKQDGGMVRFKKQYQMHNGKF